MTQAAEGAPGWSGDETALAQAIGDACRRLGLTVPDGAAQPLAAYAAALWRANQRLNLTRHTDVERFVARDVADSAAIAPHLAAGERVLDVGTGGGVPGVILAIVRPDLRVELADSVAKKARAVAAIVAELGLALPVHEGPAQALVARQARTDRFDTLVVRAVAPLVKLLAWFEPVADSYGRMLVVKGPRWEEEKRDARHRGALRRLTVRRIAAWPLPGSDNSSVLLELRPRAEAG